VTHTPSSSSSQPDRDAEALRNPDTPAGELARIATRRPDLHPVITEHPHCFPALTSWIAAQGATTVPHPVAQADDAEEEHLDEPSTVPQQSSQESAQPEEARDEPEVAPGSSEGPERPEDAPGSSEEPEDAPDSSEEPAVPEEDQPDQPSADPAPSGVRRRSVTKALPIGVGIAVIGALTGVGAWKLSQRSKNAAAAATSPDENRGFSVSALSGEFIRGVTQAWSINSFAAKGVSPAGDCLFGEYYAQDTDEQPAGYRIYPLADSGLGDPVDIPSSSWNKDDQRDPSRFSAWQSWWGGSPMWKDMVIDPHSGEVAPVPWDASSSLFLGAVDSDSALLLEVQPGEESAATGAMIAVDRQGNELWRTSESYTNAFFDPSQPDILIGYQAYSTSAQDEHRELTPHLVSTSTGEMVAALPPFKSGKDTGGIVLAADGLVVLTSIASKPGVLTAHAFSFTGSPQWEQDSNCAGVRFNGVPSLEVVRHSLAELSGVEAVVAENGVAFVPYEGGCIRWNDDGVIEPLLSLGYDSTEKKWNLTATILADGSGFVDYAADSEGNKATVLVDVSTGSHLWEIPSAAPTFSPLFQSMRGSLPSAGQVKSHLGAPTRLLIPKDKTVSCYVPAQ